VSEILSNFLSMIPNITMLSEQSIIRGWRNCVFLLKTDNQKRQQSNTFFEILAPMW